jgi:serine/threonine protein kinase
MTDESGRTLKDRFVLQEKIGSGGMGDVYKALDLRQQEAQVDPYLALKLLNNDFAKRKDAFIALQREASKTRAIASPNIVQVYDFDRDGETFFIGMEILEGKSLDEFLNHHRKGVPREEAFRIIDGFCKGLIDAHSQNTIHSDFKPGNIFYSKDKTVKVLDFGIARVVQNPGTSPEGDHKTVFDPGSLGALTPAYASYEMLSGEVPSKSDDVFAAALVAYELLTGKHPYGREPADEALKNSLAPERIRALSGGQWRALKKALALKQVNRTGTIEDFRSSLLKESLTQKCRKLFGR